VCSSDLASERRVQSLMPPDILVTTPETLQLLMVGKKLRSHLEDLRWVVVDEVHELADNKRGVQLSILLERLRFMLGRELQVVGLSATVGNPEEVAKLLVGLSGSCEVVVVPAHKQIKVDVHWPEPTPMDGELSNLLMVPPEVVSRIRFIRSVVEGSRSTLIFCNTRPTSEMLSSRFKLWDEKIPIYVHHGSLSPNERLRVEEMLRSGTIKGVVCTSSMELGIDVGHVDMVIQYNSPREVQRLIQRVGRSGHSLERISRGVVVVGDSDDALESIVLKSRLEQGLIESSRIPRKPLDVLAHELVGYVVSGGRDIREFFTIVKSAWPYRDLELSEVEEVADFLGSIGLLRRVGGLLLPAGRRTFEYFYGVLSMIPEVKQYYVVEEGMNPVGALDDYFVSEYCDVGARFIMAGRPWEVTAITEDAVYVKAVDDFEGAVPSWVGEEIPVPFEVAQEVGAIRGLVASKAEGHSLDEIAELLSNKYGVSKALVQRAVKDVYVAARNGVPVPSDRIIVVEDAGEIIVVHAHFGNRVNRALGKYIAYMIARGYGLPVYVSEKPYRIVLRCAGATAEEVAGILCGADGEAFLSRIKAAVEDSRAFRWRLQQVARRMGVIAPGAKLGAGDVERLVQALKDTPAYKEALRECLYMDLDVDNAVDVVEKIRLGLIKVVTARGPSPLTMEHIRYLGESLEPVQPEKRDLISYLLFKIRLMQSFVSLACTECGAVFEKQVNELQEDLRCPSCGSASLAFDTIPEEDMLGRLDKCLEARRARGCRSFWTSVRLFERYGLKAVLARAAGFSLKETAALLRDSEGDTESLIRQLWRMRRESVKKRVEKLSQGLGPGHLSGI